jgi:hypothetical protein
MPLGDLVATALSIVGITSDVVATWLGRPCGCARRQEQLNQLGAWARRVAAGKVEHAQEYLHNILNGN